MGRRSGHGLPRGPAAAGRGVGSVNFCLAGRPNSDRGPVCSPAMSESRTAKLGRRRILLGAALPLAFGASGCGYLLYPERKGTKGGEVDTPILIVDLIWLLPGIIPGVICLIVDFTTGCIYRKPARAERDPAPAGSKGR